MLNLLKELVARARCSDEGVTTVEYAVMLALIVIAVTSFGLGIFRLGDLNVFQNAFHSRHGHLAPK